MTNDYAASEWARITGCTCPPIWHGVIPPTCPRHNPATPMGYRLTTTTNTFELDPDPLTVTDDEPHEHNFTRCRSCDNGDLQCECGEHREMADPEAPSGRAIVWLLVALVIAAVVAWRIVR